MVVVADVGLAVVRPDQPDPVVPIRIGGQRAAADVGDGPRQLRRLTGQQLRRQRDRIDHQVDLRDLHRRGETVVSRLAGCAVAVLVQWVAGQVTDVGADGQPVLAERILIGEVHRQLAVVDHDAGDLAPQILTFGAGEAGDVRHADRGRIDRLGHGQHDRTERRALSRRVRIGDLGRRQVDVETAAARRVALAVVAEHGIVGDGPVHDTLGQGGVVEVEAQRAAAAHFDASDFGTGVDGRLVEDEVAGIGRVGPDEAVEIDVDVRRQAVDRARVGRCRRHNLRRRRRAGSAGHLQQVLAHRLLAVDLHRPLACDGRIQRRAQSGYRARGQAGVQADHAVGIGQPQRERQRVLAHSLCAELEMVTGVDPKPVLVRVAEGEIGHAGHLGGRQASHGLGRQLQQPLRSGLHGGLVRSLHRVMQQPDRLARRQRERPVARQAVVIQRHAAGRQSAGAPGDMRQRRIPIAVAVVGGHPMVGDVEHADRQGVGAEELRAAVGPQVAVDRQRDGARRRAGVGHLVEEAREGVVGRHIDLAVQSQLAADRVGQRQRAAVD